MSETNPATAVASCQGCAGRCCTTYVVPLTGYDVWAIVQAQRLAPALFVQREPEDYPTDAGFRLRSGGPTYALALQHQPARHNERPCVFLLQLREGFQRCGIYADRPLACQTYPMQALGNRVVPRSDMLCPPGSWQRLGQAQAPWRERLRRQDREWRRYARVAQAWNTAMSLQPPEGGAVLEQYLNYLVNAYDYLEAISAPQAGELIDPATERWLAALAETCCGV